VLTRFPQGDRRRNQWLCAALAALLLLAHSVFVQAAEPPEADCIIMPRATVEVGSAVPGLIEELLVERGDRVEQGQVLGKLESKVEQATLAVAKARADMINEIKLGRINLAFDQRQQKRVNTLYERKSVSLHNKDEANTDAKLSYWRLSEAVEKQQLKELEMQRAQAVLNRRVLRSPISGTVVERYKSVGEYVEDESLLKIVDLDVLYVEAIVAMELFGQISEGMRVDVLPETVAGESYPASVIVVDPMGDAASGTFGVRAELPNPENRLPAGQRCQVRFHTPEAGRQASRSRPRGNTASSRNALELSHAETPE